MMNQIKESQAYTKLISFFGCTARVKIRKKKFLFFNLWEELGKQAMQIGVDRQLRYPEGAVGGATGKAGGGAGAGLCRQAGEESGGSSGRCSRAGRRRYGS